MKTLPPMLEIAKLLWVLFLIPYLGIWDIHGETPCIPGVVVTRKPKYSASVGTSFDLECYVIHCGYQFNMTWCKVDGKNCLPIRDGLKEKNHSEKHWIINFALHFEPVLPSDNGSYCCEVDMSLSGRLVSHFLTLDVAEQTGNNSETLLINATSASGPHAKEMAHLWLLYSLPPLAGLALLLTACFCFLCCLRKHQEKQKKSFDSTGREINMDAVPQRFGREQTEVGPRQHSRILPSDTGIYDNDPCFGAREEPEVCSKSFMEERNKNIVYASLNHSTTSVNPRPTRDMKEAPTEYAVICVKS